MTDIQGREASGPGRLTIDRLKPKYERQSIARKMLNIMDWFPTVFITFKILMLGTGMFFAIKWHYDKAKKENNEKRAVLRAGGKVAAVFVLLLLVLLFLTFGLGRMLGLDLPFP